MSISNNLKEIFQRIESNKRSIVLALETLEREIELGQSPTEFTRKQLRAIAKAVAEIDE